MAKKAKKPNKPVQLIQLLVNKTITPVLPVEPITPAKLTLSKPDKPLKPLELIKLAIKPSAPALKAPIAPIPVKPIPPTAPTPIKPVLLARPLTRVKPIEALPNKPLTPVKLTKPVSLKPTVPASKMLIAPTTTKPPSPISALPAQIPTKPPPTIPPMAAQVLTKPFPAILPNPVPIFTKLPAPRITSQPAKTPAKLLMEIFPVPLQPKTPISVTAKPVVHVPINAVNVMLRKPLGQTSIKFSSPAPQPPPFKPAAVMPFKHLLQAPTRTTSLLSPPLLVPAQTITHPTLVQTPIKPYSSIPQPAPVAAPPLHIPATNIGYATVPAVSQPAQIPTTIHPLPVAAQLDHTSAAPAIAQIGESRVLSDTKASEPPSKNITLTQARQAITLPTNLTTTPATQATTSPALEAGVAQYLPQPVVYSPQREALAAQPIPSSQNSTQPEALVTQPNATSLVQDSIPLPVSPPTPTTESTLPQDATQREALATEPIATPQNPMQPESPVTQPDPAEDSNTPPASPPAPTTESDLPAPINPAPQDTVPSVDTASSPTADGTSMIAPAPDLPQENVQVDDPPSPTSTISLANIQSASTTIPDQFFPPINGTLELVPNAASLNNGMLLNDGTILSDAALVNNITLHNNLHGIKLASTSPNKLAAGPSYHSGATVGGIFASFALIAMLLGIFVLARRRRPKNLKVDNGINDFMQAPSNCSPPPMTQAHSRKSFDGTSDTLDPTLSSGDPVTRFSHGGVALLKHLESLKVGEGIPDKIISTPAHFGDQKTVQFNAGHQDFSQAAVEQTHGHPIVK
ncbi:hypothetical protein PtB15_7B734 [Puccinia triticina]|nr:hypothetical protein PtB15_7B734 [Puccinia triticina]